MHNRADVFAAWHSDLNLRPQNAAPGDRFFPFPRLRHCLQDRIISLLHVMHTAKYTKVEPSYKNCHIDIYFKAKNTSSEMLNPVPYFSKHSIQSYETLPVAVATSQCFEAPAALSLSLMLSFYRTNVELVFPTRVFPNPTPVFLSIFYYPGFFNYQTQVF